MDGICFLAANDNNKVNLVKNDIVPRLITMMTTENLAEKRSASRAVWKLAFHPDNKENFKNNKKLIEVLTNLSNVETDAATLNACKTVLWMLDEDNGVQKPRAKTAKNRDKDKSEANELGKETVLDIESLNGDEFDVNSPAKHVMISYQWGVQTQMIRLKQHLKKAGFNVWMDVDNMGGSTLESMAAAVEQSAVVLICFTEKYKNSPSCRTEAEYTYKLQKPFIPLRLQEDYDPDGWLGIMIGTKLWVDFSISETLDESRKKLKQLLGDRGRICEENQPDNDCSLNNPGAPESEVKRSNNFHRASVSIKQPKPPADAREVASWSTCQVSSWLAAHGLSELKNRFEGYNGQRLLGLKTIATDAPDFFFTEIKKDFGFKSLLDILKFKQALDEII
ncbi:uncharacterized protein LOC117298380 [Asterias rubens]|uniref:uncharacterized protein LOC117298380 n=1 Tax=Asterias rubens TaxID=7604 RepID=UPI00145565BC|nr:uncharacterized protein LOC117298380 [Asterias rubens]